MTSRGARVINAAIIGDLLPVALRVRPPFLLRVEVEPLDELVAVGGVVATRDRAEELQDLPARQLGPHVELTGDVGEVAVRLDRVVPGVDPEHLGTTGGGLDEPEQGAQCGGLAGPVGAEEANDLASVDVEAEPIERREVTEALRGAVEADDGIADGRHGRAPLGHVGGRHDGP
jgi:hypothetical protein